MPEYMRRLWRSGRCPYLVPVAFYHDRAGVSRQIQPEGLICVSRYADVCPDGIEDSFHLMLEMLASAADSFAALQSWLADPAYISLRPEDLYYDRGKGRTLLLFCETPDRSHFALRFADLCDAIGGSGPLVAQRFRDICACTVLEERGTASFLRRWSRVIREGPSA